MRNVLALAALCAAIASPVLADPVVGWDGPKAPAEVRQGAKLCTYPAPAKPQCWPTAYPVPALVHSFYEDGSVVVTVGGELWSGKQTDVSLVERNGSRTKLVRWIMGNRAR